MSRANQTHSYLSNGDDGYALVVGSEDAYTVLDRLGDFGADPGDGWDVAGVVQATKDHTLIRKASINNGNPDWKASAGTNTENSEWEVKSIDDWTSLGNR